MNIIPRVTISARRAFLILLLASTGCFNEVKKAPKADANNSVSDAIVLGQFDVASHDDGPANPADAAARDARNEVPQGTDGPDAPVISTGGVGGAAGNGGGVGAGGVAAAGGTVGGSGGVAAGGIVAAGGTVAAGGGTVGGGGTAGGGGGVGGGSGGTLAGTGGIKASGGTTTVVDAAVDQWVPLTVGAKCVASSDCALGNCIDGICCATTCTGCNACAGTLTGKSDGTCAPVVGGQDPHNTCADETATNQCGNDGMCDGAGACRKVSTSHVCTPAACSAGSFTPVVTCDGFGACGTPKPEDCGAFQCATTGCLKTCSVQTDCGGTNYCNITSGTSGTCAAKKVNGTTATQTFECVTGIVADGVCCDKACTGCSACSGSPLTGGAAGQCLPVVANQVAHSACTASGTTCGLDGKCDGTGKCRYPASGIACGSTCSVSTLTPKLCDGAGNCTASNPQTCPNATACAADGTCSTKKLPGASCTGDTDCNAGTCQDNAGGTAKICCNTSCGACNGCNASGTACVNKNPGVTDTACGATSSNCLTNVCSGGACQKAASGTHCGVEQSCPVGGSTKTLAQTCNTSGVCSAISTVPCADGCAANNDCVVPVCGNGIKQSNEDCDPPSSSSLCPYNPVSTPCQICSSTCKFIAGTKQFCGDSQVQSANELCDNGPNNNVLNTCSPLCRTCANAAGLEPQIRNDQAWVAGMRFDVIKPVYLHQFFEYHDDVVYRTELRQIINPADISTSSVVWSNGTNAARVPPVSPAFDTIVPNGSAGFALGVGSYMLLHYGHEIVSPGGSPTPGYPIPALGGAVSFTSSYENNDTNTEWFQGGNGMSSWEVFTNLHFCLQGLN